MQSIFLKEKKLRQSILGNGYGRTPGVCEIFWENMNCASLTLISTYWRLVAKEHVVVK